MSLMEDWEVLANQYNTDQATAQKFWTDYYMQEKAVYEKMLTEPVEVEKGTVAELAEKYGMDVVRFGGFLDGINESLKTPNPVDTMATCLIHIFITPRADHRHEQPVCSAPFPLGAA